MKFIFNFLLGIMFGFGLILSNIFNPKTLNFFFHLSPDWNPSILFTMCGILTASFLIQGLSKQITRANKTKFIIHQTSELKNSYVIGAILFGTGWGISGFSVSTATMNIAFNEWQCLLFFLFTLTGFYGPEFLKKIVL